MAQYNDFPDFLSLNVPVASFPALSKMVGTENAHRTAPPGALKYTSSAVSYLVFLSQTSPFMIISTPLDGAMINSSSSIL